MKMKKLLFFALAACTLGVSAQNTVTRFDELNSFKGDFAAGDIDGNGTMDFIYSGTAGGGEVGAIMLNDGKGNFTAQEGERVIKIGQGGNIMFGDIDGDGDLDVAFTGWGEGSNVANRGIALNDGTGVFTLQSRDLYPVQNFQRVSSCGFADFNKDGLLDYYFIGQNQTIDGNPESNAYIYLQQADGSFSAVEFSFVKELKIVEPEVNVVDFNNDGYMDLSMTAHSDARGRRFVAVFIGQGDGTFTLGAEADKPKATGSHFWQDIDGDGYMDMLLNGNGGPAEASTGETSDFIWRIYKNVNGQSLQAVQDFSDRGMARQSSVGNGSYVVDWDNDGKLDLLIGGWSEVRKVQVTEVHRGVNPQTFEFATYMDAGDNAGVSEQAYRIADLDGDNKVDLLFCGWGSVGHQTAGWVKNNTATASTLPEAPAALNATVNGSKVTFSWEAPASENGKYGTTYNLSLRNKTTGKWMYNPMANLETGWRKVGGRMGNMCLNKQYTLTLPDGEYEWTVQALNGAYLGGAFAPVKTFTVGEGQGTLVEETVTPARVWTAADMLVVKGEPAQELTVAVYAVNGAKVLEQTCTGQAEIALEQGAWLVEVRTGACAPYRTKVIMQ